MTSRGLDRSPVGIYRAQQFGSLDRDPFEVLDEVGHLPPYWVDNPGDIDGYWVVTRYEDAVMLLQDVENFSSRDFYIPAANKMDHPMIPIETDPPDTQKIRRIVAPYMTAKRAAALEAHMREICVGIIEGLRDRGACDAVVDFARVYPIAVFLEFFGLPADLGEQFRVRAQRFLQKYDQQDWRAIRAIVAEQIQAKRGREGADLLTAIANSDLDGQPLDVETAVNIAATVFLGGLDTLPSNIGWSLHHLAMSPDMRRKLVSKPELVPAALEEFLRLYAVANPLRRVKNDIEFQGATMRADDRVHVSISAANRDPAEFGRGVRLDREVNRHITFGVGPHRCLGSHIARSELGIALEEWHKAIPDYSIPEGTKLTYQAPIFALETLPLEWEV